MREAISRSARTQMVTRFALVKDERRSLRVCGEYGTRSVAGILGKIGSSDPRDAYIGYKRGAISLERYAEREITGQRKPNR